MKFNEYNSFCKMFKPTIKIITRKLIKKILLIQPLMARNEIHNSIKNSKSGVRLKCP